MAFSPSPTSPLGMVGPGSLHPGRRSPTPPAPLSKRDKRRQQHLTHQQDLIDDFDNNRDHHYRTQLFSLQNDLNLITQADPYNPEPLEDSPEEIARLVQANAAGTPFQSEMSTLAGRWYSEFVFEVNHAKEEKEVEVIQLKRNHEARLERMQYECDFRLHQAAEEYESMTSTIRERLAQQLNHRRVRLMKEKEQLDIADTNALLLHPNQFSITNPTSPGGPSSRKTRFARQRVDADEVGNGLGGEVTNKRKRKAADDDLGSPSRNGISTPAERAKAKMLATQTAPLNSIHTLFTEKELQFQSNQARIAAKHFFSTSHKEGETNGVGKRSRDDDGDKSGGSAEESGGDDDEGLEAPEMDRTASQNVHVTRSTRNTGAMAGLNILSDLAEKAATRPTLPYATLHAHPTRPGAFMPSPSGLMPEEIGEDVQRLALYSAQPKGAIDREAVEEALKPLAEGRSNLAPDWPAYLDVHLVNMEQSVSDGRGMP